jgi:hypothetical protein
MKCYYHTDKDAVGTCSQCSKAACRDCIQDVGGALLCKDCVAAAKQAVADEVEASVAKAKRSLVWSWVFTAIASVFIISLIADAKDFSATAKFFLSLFCVYAAWSTFWGWKVVWPWWRNIVGRIGCFLIANPMTWLFVMLLFFYIPFIGAYMYGCLGGGIYQFLKYRKVARGEM